MVSAASARATTAGKPGSNADLYAKMKALQRQLEFLEIQEEYIKDEMQNLKRELVRAKEEVKKDTPEFFEAEVKRVKQRSKNIARSISGLGVGLED